MKPFYTILILFLLLLTYSTSSGQTDNEKTTQKRDYQIYLKQPAKELRLLMNEKNFFPIQGKLSEDRKSIIINNYEPGTRVHIKVVYEDGTIDEYIKSPCFIDPVI